MPGATVLHMRVSLKAVGWEEADTGGEDVSVGPLMVCLVGGCFGSSCFSDVMIRDITWVVIRKVNCRDVWEIRSRPRWLMRPKVDASRIYPNGS